MGARSLTAHMQTTAYHAVYSPSAYPALSAPPPACSKAERMEPSTQQIVESVLLAQKQNPYHAEEAWVWFREESAAHNPKKGAASAKKHSVTREGTWRSQRLENILCRVFGMKRRYLRRRSLSKELSHRALCIACIRGSVTFHRSR